MNRRTTLVLFAQALIPDQAAADSEQFRRLWNQFAVAGNLLIEKEKAGVWDVRQARRVEQLFDRLRKSPWWRT